MASKRVSEKPPSASDLIAAHVERVAGELTLPPSIVGGLRQFMEHNDRAVAKQRIPVTTALQWLAEHGHRMGRSKFSLVIRHHFQRGWGG